MFTTLFATVVGLCNELLLTILLENIRNILSRRCPSGRAETTASSLSLPRASLNHA
ncbi:hypothetical protein TSMEX_008974 [Taenia solium]|eukprot:TsM_000480000 transcript=TsM_000480000 gene=TsM_000480000